MTADNGSAPDPGNAAIDPELLELATAVFEFARGGAAEQLAAYLDAGVPVNLTNDRGDTLLMLAAYHGHRETVAVLLARGADPNRANDHGQTPLAGVVFKGETEIVGDLLAAGADPDAGAPSARAAATMFGKTDLLKLFG
ncbi:ankyrin repeat domain-containing protein [Nocardia cyriacigeorgica]|uniref:ankyrin repeat domain-containing protein n=1 Tax=Nocardia cyriacigeorgica TaxID=135487 RepID=UPI002453D126|nr:ankyrin repeat domain-containing protein [Nocardia cyriacigeorgica]